MIINQNPSRYVSTIYDVIEDAIKDNPYKGDTDYLSSIRSKFGPILNKYISESYYSSEYNGMVFNIFIVEPLYGGLREDFCPLTPYTCGNRPAGDDISCYISYHSNPTGIEKTSFSVLVQSNWMDSMDTMYYALIGIFDQYLSLFYNTLEDRAIPSVIMSLNIMALHKKLTGGSGRLTMLNLPSFISKSTLYRKITKKSGKFTTIEQCFVFYNSCYYEKYIKENKKFLENMREDYEKRNNNKKDDK